MVLVAGVFGYFVAGAACCVTYALNEHETPGIVQTIATGFGGYVIAYLALAYKDAFTEI